VNDTDLILIAQSEVVNYEAYSSLPLDRIDLCRELIYPRMIRFRGRFMSHVDLLNVLREDIAVQDGKAGPQQTPLSGRK
jgi:p-methyltransferase